MEKYQDSILTKFNRDEHGNPISVNLVETQVVTKKGLVQLMQFPDEFNRVCVQNENGEYLTETQNAYSIGENQFYVNYANGVVYFHPSQVAQSFKFTYAGRGVELISTSRIFHKYHEEGDDIVRTMTDIVDELVEISKDAVDEEYQRQQNELNRIERFDAQMEQIQQEIFDKDSAFQSQLIRQEEEYQEAKDVWDGKIQETIDFIHDVNDQRQEALDTKLQEVEDRILSNDSDFDKHLNSLDERFEEKLEEWKQEVTDLPGEFGEIVRDIQSRLAVDLSKEPIYYKTLRGIRSTVMQQFIKLKDGTFLFSQGGATDAPASPESFTISRLAGDGKVLDYMRVFCGGHGWIQARQLETKEIEVYFTTADSRLIKTTYQPNTVLDLRTSEGYEELPNLTDEYQLMAIDFENDLLILLIKTADEYYQRAYIHSLSKYVAGEATSPLLTIQGITKENTVLQGIALYGGQAFFTYGEIGKLCTMRVYDFETNTFSDYEYPGLAHLYDNDDTITEGEGLFIDESGIYMGVSTGTSGALRTNNIYVFAPVDQQSRLLAHTLEFAQTHPLTTGSGHAKSVATKPLLLADITEPGEYYFTAATFDFEDVPTEYRGVSGYWLNVSARALDGTVFQTLTRNTASANPYRIGRQVHLTTGVAAPWSSLTPERKLLWTGDTRTVTTFTLKDSISNYDYLLIRLHHAGGAWQTFTFRTDTIMASKQIYLQATNISDSETSLNFYAQELVCDISDDSRTITQTRKSQIQITNGGVITRTENSQIGICEVEGIRGFNVL